MLNIVKSNEEQLRKHENESLDIPPDFAADLLALLHSVGWPLNKRTEVSGSGTCIGLTNTMDGPRLGFKTEWRLTSLNIYDR